jgi:hypothetical protein
MQFSPCFYALSVAEDTHASHPFKTEDTSKLQAIWTSAGYDFARRVRRKMYSVLPY